MTSSLKSCLSEAATWAKVQEGSGFNPRCLQSLADQIKAAVHFYGAMLPCKSQASGLTWAGRFPNRFFPLRRDASQEGYQHFPPFSPLAVKKRSFLDHLLLNPQCKSLGCLVLLLFDSHLCLSISFIAGNKRELVIAVRFAVWPTCIKNGTNLCVPRWGRRVEAVCYFFLIVLCQCRPCYKTLPLLCPVCLDISSIQSSSSVFHERTLAHIFCVGAFCGNGPAFA